MRRNAILVVAILLTSLLPASVAAAAVEGPDAVAGASMPAPTATSVSERDLDGLLGSHFTPNMGQVDDPDVVFQSANAYFTPTGVVFRAMEDFHLDPYDVEGTPHPTRFHVYRMDLLDAAAVVPLGTSPLGHTSSYLVGNDPYHWARKVPNYGGIVYSDIYPGIDLGYTASASGIKYEFTVSPGASVESIRMAYVGAGLRLDDSGDTLLIDTSVGTVVDGGLLAYQPIDGVPVEVDARMVLSGNVVSYEVDHDERYPLIIDPLVYSTFIGSPGDWDSGNGIAVDSLNHTYITGAVGASNFPTTPGAFDNSYHGGTIDAFVLKLDASGSSLIWSTYVGSSGHDSGFDIAIDPSNNTYITGYSDTENFPVTPGAFCETRTPGDGFYDVVVFKVNPTGSDLVWATFVGGTGREFGEALDIDESGNVYVAGISRSSDLPSTSGAFDETYNQQSGAFIFDGFAFKLNASGATMDYLTYLGAGCDDRAYGIVLDGSNNAIIAGTTESTDFPMTNGAYDTSHNGQIDSYVLKLSSDGSDVTYSTYLGGSKDEYAFDVILDDDGNVYVAGYTNSRDFPVSENTYCATYQGGEWDGFALKVSSDWDTLEYSTYIGGGGLDQALGIAVDDSGSAVVTGATESWDFPITDDAFCATFSGNSALFLVKVSPKGSDLIYSSFFTGINEDHGSDVIIDPHGSVYVSGYSSSSDFPTTVGAYDTVFNGGNRDVVTLKLTLPTDTAPGRPINLTAVTGYGFVDLAWEEPLWDGNLAITAYKVYKGTVADDLSLLTTLGAVTTYNDTDVTNGVTYYYAVTATNSVGEGARSHVLEATPGSPPFPPDNLIAIAGNMHISLSWLPPPDDGGFAVEGYTVYRGYTEDALTELVSFGPSVFSYKDDALKNGIQLFYVVTASNERGESPPSNMVNATPGRLPSAPMALDGVAGDGYVHIDWSLPFDDGGFSVQYYNVYRGGSADDLPFLNSTDDPAVLDLNDTGVENGQLYYYRVAAVNALGEGEASNIFNARPQAPPGPPANLTTEPGPGAIALSWEKPLDTGGLDIMSYNVYKAVGGGELSVFITVDEASYDDYAVTNDVTYRYAVSAINAAGEGIPCEEVSATPTATKRPPGVPLNLTATGGFEEVALSWVAPLYDGGLPIGGYVVYRCNVGGVPLQIGNTTNLSFADPDVDNFKTYLYAVAAVNAVGEGQMTDLVAAMPAGAPGKVGGLAAVPGDTGVVLSWNAPAETGGAPIKGYMVYRAEGTAPLRLLAEVAESTGRAFSDISVVNGVTYRYAVSAHNGYAEGPQSDGVDATPGAPPGPPTGVEAKVQGKKVVVSWGPPLNDSGFPVQGYKVYRAVTGGEMEVLGEATGTSYTDTDVKAGKSYHYKVTAFNEKGEGDASEVSSLTVGSSTTAGEGSFMLILLIIAVIVAVVLVIGGLAYRRWGV